MPPRKTAAPATITQSSPLLYLPAELRNTIYEYVAANTTLISYRHQSLLYTPALSKVCRQIRTEYSGIYATDAPRYAKDAEIHITNFVHADVIPTIEAISNSVPETPIYSRYSFRLCILLTNTFDHSREQLRMLDVGIDTNHDDEDEGEPIMLKCEHRFVFNHRTFDVEYAVQAMQKMNWCLAQTPPPRKRNWRAIYEAFTKAIEQYRAECTPKRKPTRSRKANGGKRRKV